MKEVEVFLWFYLYIFLIQVEDDVLKAVRIAVKAGYRHLDCAAIYRNERAVGQALKQLIVESTITRKDIFVTSKVNLLWFILGFL